MRIIQLIIFFIAIQISLQAQYTKLERHWSFEASKSNHLNIVNGEAKLQYVKGVKGQGVLMQEDGNCLEVKEGVDLMQDFTLSFWFKPQNINKLQTLFYQFKQLPNDLNIRHFIKLEIKNKSFSLKTGNRSFPLKKIPLETNKWYSVTYLYNGKETKLYLQGQEIYSTDARISFYGQYSRDIRNRLFIGKSHTYDSQFEGVIDEIMVFQKAVNNKIISNIYSTYAPKKNISKKTNKVTTIVGSTIPVENRKRKSVNYGELEEILKKDNKSPTFEKPSDEKSPDDILFIDDYKVLSPLVVRTTTIQLEFWNRTIGNDNVQITLALNDKLLNKPFVLSQKKQTITIPLNLGKENSLLFEAFQLKKNQKCKIGINLLADGKRIANHVFDLSQHNIMIPVGYVKKKDEKPRHHKTVTVNSTNITIQIKDHSKVDGDIITIKQGNKILLANYTLTSDLKNVNVQLLNNKENKFTFIPISMGKFSGENTALVLIKVDGRIVHDFSLRSIDIKKPARLTIIHKSL